MPRHIHCHYNVRYFELVTDVTYCITRKTNAYDLSLFLKADGADAVQMSNTNRWSTNVNFPSMLCLEMNSVELDAAARSLVLGELVTCRRPIATRQQCVPAAGEASSASVPPTDDMLRSA